MSIIGRWSKYVGGFLLFLVCYALASLAGSLFIAFIVNRHANGWFAMLTLPYFLAAMAGALGAAGGLWAVARLIPSVRLRPIAWAYVAAASFLAVTTAIGIASGNALEDGLSERAMQMLAGAITLWQLSGQLDMEAQRAG